MKIKFLCAAAALTAAFTGTAAFAEDAPTPEFTITGSAAIVSQYKFRGLSQSDNKPAVQMAITVADKSGFYISAWGSSTYGDPAFTNSPISPGGTEIDVYGGYTHSIGKSGVTFDGGAYGYIYPNGPAANYYELYASLTKAYGPVTAKAGVYFAPPQKVFNLNFNSPHRVNAYKYVELSYAVPSTPVTLHSHLGHTAGGFDYAKQYLDYNVGVSYKWKALTFDVSGVGTDISSTDIAKSSFAAPAGTVLNSYFKRPAKSVVVLSVTASF